MRYDQIVSDEIEQHSVSPIDMLGIGDMTSEYTYLKSHQDSYIRTVRDVDALFNNDASSRHVLEIGSFLGTVSISLKKIGYAVSSCDIPEFYSSPSLRNLYESNGIHFNGLNLKHAKLPYESNSFDIVIMCEVLEHLNFNPLPVISEISRVLKSDGYIYIGMPNQSNIGNRLKLALGRSIHNPIEEYFKQLNRNINMVVGLHWREYTLPETLQMIRKMGFNPVKKYYYIEKAVAEKNLLTAMKMMAKKILYLYPPFRPSQVVIGKKDKVPVFDFWLTEANS